MLELHPFNENMFKMRYTKQVSFPSIQVAAKSIYFLKLCSSVSLLASHCHDLFSSFVLFFVLYCART